MTALSNLHQSTAQPTPAWPALFQPQWDDAMTEAALTFFAEDERPKLWAILRDLQQQAQPLFEPRVWISGDPNPNNWGMRADGSVVLFDWERFGKGTPALDVAITVPGLGDASAFQAAATQYGDPTLTRDLALAKLWTVVELLAHAQQGKVGDMSIIPLVVQALPDWLKSTF